MRCCLCIILEGQSNYISLTLETDLSELYNCLHRRCYETKVSWLLERHLCWQFDLLDEQVVLTLIIHTFTCLKGNLF